MKGPGKYDDVATAARESAKANGVLLVVIGGDRGHGFSAQFTNPDHAKRVPAMLRTIADQIERDGA